MTGPHEILERIAVVGGASRAVSGGGCIASTLNGSGGRPTYRLSMRQSRLMFLWHRFRQHRVWSRSCEPLSELEEVTIEIFDQRDLETDVRMDGGLRHRRSPCG